MHCLLGRSTGAVDGGCRCAVRQAGVQPRLTRDVVGLFASLRDTTADDLSDVFRCNACPFEDPALRCSQNLGGVQSRQGAAATADRCACGFDDDCMTHDACSSVEISVGELAHLFTFLQCILFMYAEQRYDASRVSITVFKKLELISILRV
jgi:hypothetical protein